MSLRDESQRRAHAARLGVVLFLASEGLLFAGLFALYAAYRVRYPAAFAEGVRLDLRWLGTLNTGLLLASSACMAAVVALLTPSTQPHPDAAMHTRMRQRWARILMLATLALGTGFLVLKGVEYADHLAHGIVPGGHSAWYAAHAERGLPVFFALYYLMTGLHALHMVVGITWVAVLVRGARVEEAACQRVELGALYWHFVDLVWVVLWPLFYLMRA